MRRLKIPATNRQITATLNEVFRQERNSGIFPPRENLFPAAAEMAECINKVNALETLIQDVRPNMGFDNIFMSRYIHVLNRLKRIQCAGNADLSTTVFELIERMVNLRTRFNEIVTGFRTRHQLNRSVVTTSTGNERSEDIPSDSVVNVTVTRTSVEPNESVAPVSLPISLATGTNVTQSRTTPTMLTSERSGPLPCEREDIDEPLNLSISQNVQSQLENENQRRMNGISEIESVNRESSLDHSNSADEMNVRIKNACVDFEGEYVAELSNFRTKSLGFSSTQTNRLSSEVTQLINQLKTFNRNVSQASPSIQPQKVESIENFQRSLQPDGCGQTMPVHQREPNTARQSNKFLVFCPDHTSVWNLIRLRIIIYHK